MIYLVTGPRFERPQNTEDRLMIVQSADRHLSGWFLDRQALVFWLWWLYVYRIAVVQNSQGYLQCMFDCLLDCQDWENVSGYLESQKNRYN